MGVDTKGVLVSPLKDVMLVSTIIEKSLNSLVHRHQNLEFPGVRFHSEESRERFETVRCRLAPHSGMVNFSFKCFGENRDLHVFFDCDSDHVDLAPKTLSMSLGLWGQSELYVKTVLHALSLFGPVHFDRSDCDDVPLAELDSEPINLLLAVKLGYISSYMLEDLVPRFEAGDFGVARSFKDFVGMTKARYEKLAKAEDYKVRWDSFEAEAHKLDSIELPLLIETA